jgi:hypothetical protein
MANTNDDSVYMGEPAGQALIRPVTSDRCSDLLGNLQAPFIRPAGATEVLLVRHRSAAYQGLTSQTARARSRVRRIRR